MRILLWNRIEIELHNEITILDTTIIIQSDLIQI